MTSASKVVNVLGNFSFLEGRREEKYANTPPPHSVRSLRNILQPSSINWEQGYEESIFVSVRNTTCALESFIMIFNSSNLFCKLFMFRCIINRPPLFFCLLLMMLDKGPFAYCSFCVSDKLFAMHAFSSPPPKNRN